MRSQHEAYCPLYLSGGVTTVKTPGEFEPDLTWQWKQDIEKGEKVGPRIMTGGYYFDPTDTIIRLSLIHISEPTRLLSISYAVFCLKKNNIFQFTIPFIDLADPFHILLKKPPA